MLLRAALSFHQGLGIEDLLEFGVSSLERLSVFDEDSLPKHLAEET